MAITKLADVIVPEIFTPYVVKRSKELSVLLNSGIMKHDTEFDELASGKDAKGTMPYWNDLTGDEEDIVEDEFTTPGNITSGKELFVKRAKVKSWGANALSSYFSGDRPMERIGDLVAGYRARQDQKYLIQTLDGVFKSTSMKDLNFDISAKTAGAELLEGASFVDATQSLGDAKDNVTGVIMHSIVEAYLVKRQLIEYVTTVNELGQSTRIPYFMGKRVLVDDSMPFDTGSLVASVYIFGADAIAYGIGTHPDIVQTEVTREAMSRAGEDFLINRRVFIMHPRGISFTAEPVGPFATDTEITTGTNWNLVLDKKNIRMIKFTFKIKP